MQERAWTTTVSSGIDKGSEMVFDGTSLADTAVDHTVPVL
jgi:hypothetical protein